MMTKNKNTVFSFIAVVVMALLVACGGADKKGADGVKTEGGRVVGPDGEAVITKKAREDFDAVVAKYNEALKEGFTKEECESIASKFSKVADKHGGMPEAAYNVGAVYAKCEEDDKAKAAFKDLLKQDEAHQLALTHLAVMELKKGDIKTGQEYLNKAVGAGKNTLEAVPAYTNAATVLRQRGVEKGDEEAFAKAQTNLRRALAIDSKYMPALYQLAVLYYDVAKHRKKSSYLTLSSLVCNQAIQLDPEFGRIYHLVGQINLAKGDLVEALKAFEAAFGKDPTLFESYLNFAAINLNFRGYEQSKVAFEKAIALNPKSYDAHIGLGVALRGLGDYAGARTEYKKASEIDKQRTDYIFNLGVLEMDYEIQNKEDMVQGYMDAKKVFQKFLKHATEGHKKDPDGKGKEKSWYAKAEQRITKCDENAKQIEEAMKEMAELERLAAEQAKAAAEAQKMMEKAAELEAQEAAGAEAEGAEADEKAAEDAMKAEEEAAKAEAKAKADKAAELEKAEKAGAEAPPEEGAAEGEGGE